MQKPDLAAVLSSRICHDLVSPVGAIVNGIDLMREIGGGDMKDELGMIGQSAERAAGLLQFYRVAFGAVGDEAAPISRSTLRDQAAQLIVTPRIELAWHDVDGPELQRGEARLLFLLVLCGKALLGMRGAVAVHLGAVSTWPMAVTVDNGLGEVAPPTPDEMDLLSGKGLPTPRQIEFALAHEAAHEMGLSLAVRDAGGRLSISVI